MGDKNRNRQNQQYDWRDDYGRPQSNDDYNEEPNYTISENRGHRDNARYGRMESGEGSWQGRYERQMNSSREGDFNGGGYYKKQYSRQGESDYNPGTVERRTGSGYSDFGGDPRNLYDRGNPGISRPDYENRGNRMGGAHYDQYGERWRYNAAPGGYYSGPPYGRSGNREYDRDDYRNREYGRGGNEERSWWDKTTDEVSSWFGDEEAERRRDRDRNFSGGFRGKGPRNYSRSDERIKEDINDCLSDDPFIDATDIEVIVTNGEVTLTGTVDHRSAKRRAEDLAESVSGVKNVENRLRVNQYTGNQNPGGPGMNTPTGSPFSQSPSTVPASERSRTKDSDYANK